VLRLERLFQILDIIIGQFLPLVAGEAVYLASLFFIAVRKYRFL